MHQTIMITNAFYFLSSCILELLVQITDVTKRDVVYSNSFFLGLCLDNSTSTFVTQKLTHTTKMQRN